MTGRHARVSEPASSHAGDGSSEDLGELIQRVDRDVGEQGAAAMADELRGRADETTAADEEA